MTRTLFFVSYSEYLELFKGLIFALFVKAVDKIILKTQK